MPQHIVLDPVADIAAVVAVVAELDLASLAPIAALPLATNSSLRCHRLMNGILGCFAPQLHVPSMPIGFAPQPHVPSMPSCFDRSGREDWLNSLRSPPFRDDQKQSSQDFRSAAELLYKDSRRLHFLMVARQ